jgi:hypothetical protein
MSPLAEDSYTGVCSWTQPNDAPSPTRVMSAMASQCLRKPRK